VNVETGYSVPEKKVPVKSSRASIWSLELEAKELKRKFVELENAIQYALDVVETLGPTADKKTIASSKEAIASVPPELIQKAAESIGTAADVGDVMKIKSIAEELKSESDAMAPFCNELVELAEDFDFEGIQKVMLEIDKV
jgi:hypothetical protein